jgi:tetratricopeptide (TPR) repeat protein
MIPFLTVLTAVLCAAQYLWLWGVVADFGRWLALARFCVEHETEGQPSERSVLSVLELRERSRDFLGRLWASLGGLLMLTIALSVLATQPEPHLLTFPVGVAYAVAVAAGVGYSLFRLWPARQALQPLVPAGATALDPSVAWWTAQANRLRRAGKYAEAVEVYRQALALEPVAREKLEQAGGRCSVCGLRRETAVRSRDRAYAADPDQLYVVCANCWSSSGAPS